MSTSDRPAAPTSFVQRFLQRVETIGNKLPDPAILFVFVLFAVWVNSTWIRARRTDPPSRW